MGGLCQLWNLDIYAHSSVFACVSMTVCSHSVSEWVRDPGLGEAVVMVIMWEVHAECRETRLDLQDCYFFILHCFVGGANPSCLGRCIMECFILLPNKS